VIDRACGKHVEDDRWIQSELVDKEYFENISA